MIDITMFDMFQDDFMSLDSISQENFPQSDDYSEFYMGDNEEGMEPAMGNSLWDNEDISFKGYGSSGRLELSDRIDHIDSIYDDDIERAYDKLADDMERISKDGPYPWENPDATIRADRSSIERWERSKSEAIGQARVDQSKQDYWDAVNDYCDAVFSQKIHGK